MIFNSVEDQIEIYSDEHFDASRTAQHFFTSYGESEISKKRNDMTKLQQSIENVLKVNVRNKYVDFLVATEQINQVGHEMSELKHLIENTQKLIEVFLLQFFVNLIKASFCFLDLLSILRMQEL
jgi:hypothetical protein